ncbi:MAG TPA: NHL repeat-containing protein [Solirubrobacterales bacterium]|nr:NHL repeat-containing protein [Solirubrobacterales bacterium]
MRRHARPGRRALAAAACALLAALALGASPASAQRALITTKAVTSEGTGSPPGGIEGACGVALTAGAIYVSDYYRHRVDVFKPNGEYVSQIAAGTAPEGPCGLAVGPGGALYANLWHESVARLLPSSLSFDGEESTGVAVDQASGNVYVDDRTYVAVYEPSGAPLEVAGKALQIGLGTLGDAYGVAVSGAKAYVADAADDTIKVYEPASDPVNPVTTIGGPFGGFHSLVDASLAVDVSNGHLLAIDNLQPGFAHPEAGIEEFDSAGTYLGRVAKVVDGEPTGLALSGGNLYVTSGNDEGSRVLEYGPYTLSAPSGTGAGGGATGAAPQSQGAAIATTAAATGAPAASRRAKAHSSELVQQGRLRVAFEAAFAPKALPRRGTAPIGVSVGAKISSADGGDPPQLRRISIALNREGRFDPTGLPVCHLREIEPATTANALAACRSALVGEGHFEAKVHLDSQSPFPSSGKLYAFNARLHGRPAILAHVYGTDPVPTSYTLPFEIGRSKGTFGTTLRALLPRVTGSSGVVTGLSMELKRSFSYRGRRHSYLSAGCPAPKGFSGVPFPLAKAKLGFAGGKSLSKTLTRNCRVR